MLSLVTSIRFIDTSGSILYEQWICFISTSASILLIHWHPIYFDVSLQWNWNMAFVYFQHLLSFYLQMGIHFSMKPFTIIYTGGQCVRTTSSKTLETVVQLIWTQSSKTIGHCNPIPFVLKWPSKVHGYTFWFGKVHPERGQLSRIFRNPLRHPMDDGVHYNF